jgi:hypothetical protein
MPKGHPKGFLTGYQPRKKDPPSLVESIRSSYEDDNHTQVEIAEMMGWTPKRVQGIFRRNNIPTRPQVKRDQWGEKNHRWKGDGASYTSLHARIYRRKGKAQGPCTICKTMIARNYDWANLTGKYQDINDYTVMCRSCHAKYDEKVLNLPK